MLNALPLIQNTGLLLVSWLFCRLALDGVMIDKKIYIIILFYFCMKSTEKYYNNVRYPHLRHITSSLYPSSLTLIKMAE
jgi:hypothetical protein